MSWFINDGLFFKKYNKIECKRSHVFRFVVMGISKNEGLKWLKNSVTYDSGVLWM